MTPPAGDAVDRAAAILGSRALRDHPVGPLTTYRVGGSAALFWEASDDDDLRTARRAVTETQLPVLVVGKGSNLLVSDRGFPGLAVVLSGGFDALEIEGETVTAGGAVSLPVLARRTAAAGLAGLEWAVGVPGSVGGAVRMNAGGHGSDMAACLSECWIVDLAGGPDGRRTVAQMEYGYRRSSVTSTEVVTSARFVLRPGDREASEAAISDIVRWRRQHQPGGQNAGSVFTNPADDSAGRLIESAGLKGLRLGTAQVSDKHANFIQADSGGSAEDVAALVRLVAEKVVEATGVRLHAEVRMIGFEAS